MANFKNTLFLTFAFNNAPINQIDEILPYA